MSLLLLFLNTTAGVVTPPVVTTHFEDPNTTIWLVLFGQTHEKED